MHTVSIQRYFCNCFIGEFYLPSDKLEDEDEILCPYCGEEPHSSDVRYADIYTQKEKDLKILDLKITEKEIRI